MSRDAGFAETRTTVAARLGHAVRYDDVEDEAPSSDAAKKLLSKSLDAEAAVAVALLSSPELQAAFSRLGVARAQLLSASLPPNPELEAEVLWHADHAPNLSFAATASLTSLLTLPLLRSAADKQLSRASVQTAAHALDVAYRVRTAFYEAVAAEQDLVLMRGVVQTAALSRELIARVREAGNVPELELVSARAYEEDVRLRLEDAELRRITTRTELVRRLGVKVDPATLQLASALPEPPLDEPSLAAIEQQAFAQSLDLLALSRGHRALDAQKDAAAIAGWVPDVRAGVAVERDDGVWGVGPVAAMSLPIFDHGQGEVASLEAQKRMLEHERAATENRLRASARMLRERVSLLASRVRRYQLVLVPLRAKVTQETERHYNAMRLGATQWLIAKADELRTQQAQIATLRAYWLSRAALDLLMAGRVPASLPAFDTGLDDASSGSTTLGSSSPDVGGH